MIKNIKKIILIIIILVLMWLSYKVIKFDFNTLESENDLIIENSDRFSNAQKILEENGYELKDVQDNEKTQVNIENLKTYRYEGKNGIIAILTNDIYVYEVNYYEE